jgi:hypothetical protein
MYCCPRCDRQLAIPAHYIISSICLCGWHGNVLTDGVKKNEHISEGIDTYLSSGTGGKNETAISGR